MKAIILLTLFTILFRNEIFPQTIYKLPFGGKDNRIELTVSNTSTLAAEGVNIKVSSCPSWIKMKSVETAIGEIEAGKEKTFTFDFDVLKTALIDNEASINFAITNSMKESWTKEIKIIVSAPVKYELFQNYPNPFNPVTKISYQLPVGSRVTIKIYDMIGRELLTILDNEEKSAGYYENNFNASNLSSGVYFYQLHAGNYVSTKKMILTK